MQHLVHVRKRQLQAVNLIGGKHTPQFTQRHAEAAIAVDSVRLRVGVDQVVNLVLKRGHFHFTPNLLVCSAFQSASSLLIRSICARCLSVASETALMTRCCVVSGRTVLAFSTPRITLAASTPA